MAFVRWPLDAFAALDAGKAERDYRQLCKSRPNLTDQEFYDAFYRSTGISFDTCARVRHVLKTQLNMLNIRPDDNVAAIFEDIDFWEIAAEVAEEFALKHTDSVVNNMDGTVDSLIRCMNRMRLLDDLGDAGPPT